MLEQLKQDDFCHLAPECSSWVWMNSGTSCRSQENPLGDESLDYVREANSQNQHLAEKIADLDANEVIVLVEQPGSSRYFQTPAFKTLINMGGFQLSNLSLGWLGAQSLKPSMLLCNKPEMLDMILDMVGYAKVARIPRPPPRKTCKKGERWVRPPGEKRLIRGA